MQRRIPAACLPILFMILSCRFFRFKIICAFNFVIKVIIINKIIDIWVRKLIRLVVVVAGNRWISFINLLFISHVRRIIPTTFYVESDLKRFPLSSWHLTFACTGYLLLIYICFEYYYNKSRTYTLYTVYVEGLLLCTILKLDFNW